MSKRNEHVNEVFQPLLNSLLPEVENDQHVCPKCGGKLYPVYGFCMNKECYYSEDSNEIEK